MMGEVKVAHTHKERLMSLLFEGDIKLLNMKFFRGTQAVVSEEELCAEMCSALEQRRNGSAKVSKSFEDDAVKVDVRAWVASL